MDKNSMSALLWMPRAHEIPGGHRVQFESTADALNRIGVAATVWAGNLPDIRGWSLVHGFGLTAEEIHSIRDRGRPVALSTIYWDRSYRADQSGGKLNAMTMRRRAGLLIRSTSAAIRGPVAYLDWASDFLAGENSILAAYEAADLLLPNSAAEATSIRRDLHVTTPYHIVPNAVSPDRIGCSNSGACRDTDVLYVGRIDPHKNQLGLIEALKGTGLSLVLLGYEHPHQPDYANQCRRAGEGWVQFVPGTPDVGPHYQRAHVHVTPSWFETTGLVSLEAAIAGCNVVSTCRGHAREYLGDLAAYCDPGSRKSIRNAVLAAREAPPQSLLREHVLAHFTWDHAARATLAAYQRVIAKVG